MKKLLTSLFFLSSLTLSASGLVREDYEGVRATGMGNAFIAIADDANVLWTNPAGLARGYGFHYNVFDFTGGTDSMATLNQFKNLVFNGDSSGFLNPANIEYARFNFRHQFLTKYFGFGLFSHSQGFFDVQAAAQIFGYTIPNIDVYAVSDNGAIAGVGFPVGQYFSFGASVRAIYRTGVDANINAQQFLNQFGITTTDFQAAAFNYVKKLGGTGYGFGCNLGALARFPVGGKNGPDISLAFTAENVTNTSFRATNGSIAPPDIEGTFNAGVALMYPFARDTTFTLSTELRHIFDNLPMFKQGHLGAEIRHRFLGLRVGLNEGYFTYGASFEALPHTKIHFSSYESELGNTWNQRGTRWYLLQVAIGFSPL